MKSCSPPSSRMPVVSQWRSLPYHVLFSHDAIVGHIHRGSVQPEGLIRVSTIPGHCFHLEIFFSVVFHLSIPPPSTLYSFLKDLHLFTGLDPVIAVSTISTDQPNAHRLSVHRVCFKSPIPLNLHWMSSQVFHILFLEHTRTSTQQKLWTSLCPLI